MWTMRCTISALVLSLKLSMKNVNLPNGARAGTLRIFTMAITKRYVCSHKFSDQGATAAPAPPLPPPLPMWSRRSKYHWYTYEASCRKLNSLEVSGTPIWTRSPAGAPLSEMRPLIKSGWDPFGDPGASDATVLRGP